MRLQAIAVSLWLTAVGSAVAEDYVIIESKSFPQGRRNCQVGVYLSNSFYAYNIAIPLEIREAAPPAYPADNFEWRENPYGRTYTSALGGGWDLLGTWRGEEQLRITFYAAEPSQLPFTCSGTMANTYWHRSQSIDYHSPDGIFYQATVLTEIDFLEPGADSPGITQPSFIIEFDAGQAIGNFEIDTCCWYDGSYNFGHHLYVVSPDFVYRPVSFTKSIVTIVPCICLCVSDPICDGVTNILDVASAIDVAFRGNADIMDSTCAISRTDTNADYQTDIVDVVRLILVGFRDGDAATYLINPCAEE